MRTFGQVVQIQIIACRSLNKLIAADGEKRDQAWKAGGLAAVLAAMEMHGTVEELYTEAVAALCHMARYSSEHNKAQKEKFGDSGGIEKITAGMRARKADVEVQKLACMALHNLAGLSFNGEKIAAAAGIESILEAMPRHAHQDVQLHGCGALQALTILADNRSRAVAAGATELLVAAMAKYPNDVRLAEMASGALVNVGCGAFSPCTQALY